MYIFIVLFLLSCLLTNTAFADSPRPWQINFQDPATPVMESIIDVHHHVMMFLVLVFTFVSWLLYRSFVLFNSKKNPKPATVHHGTLLEIIWTITPAIILILIAVPSFALLYSMDELIDPTITIKAVGHQWYWSYEYSDYTSADGESIEFDSYMIPDDELEPGQLRLLEVDRRIVLPINTHVRVIITAADVLHSWAVPSLGVKMDAVPGRLNQTSLFIKREGIYYGQCSELCGVNHGYMPIVIEAVDPEDYITWISNEIEVQEENA